MMLRRLTVGLMWLFAVLPAHAYAGIIDYHVDADSPAAVGEADGLSWATAFPRLEDALAVAQGGDDIWVAAGEYHPPAPTGADPKRTAFVLVHGVCVYGGFAGVESSVDERNPQANPTVLHADIAGDDDPEQSTTRDENAYHVLELTDGVSSRTRLDGFTIRSGDAISVFGAPYVHGGGLYIESAQLAIAHCTFISNAAQNNGGAVFVKDSTVSLDDCSFSRNRSNGFGACIAVFPDNAQTRTAVLAVEGCTFQDNGYNYVLSANHADLEVHKSLFLDNEGGGLCATDRVTLHAGNCLFTRNGGMWGMTYIGTRSEAELTHCTLANNRTIEIQVVSDSILRTTLDITNSIVWNETYLPLAFDPSFATVHVSHSLIRGGFDGDGNLDAPPQFRQTKPPCQLSWDSPAIDACPDDGVADDIQGAIRPQNHGFDAGAYEFGEDSDDGGLPDAYEDDNDLAWDDPADDGMDSDGDGLDNLEEFRRGTGPQDEDAPPSHYYVDPTGSDDTGDGSQDFPWRTITFAMASVPEAIPSFPVTIHVGAGTYDETVAFRKHTTLVGAGADHTTIQHYEPSDDEHVVIVAAEGAGLRDCTVALPSAVTEAVELLRVTDVAVDVQGVTFNGMNGTNTVAVFITGADSSDSVVRYSVIKRVEYGVYAVNSGVNVTRSLFEDIREVGVFIRPPETKNGEPEVTPLLGTTEDPAESGFNRFRMSSGVYVDNESESTAVAEFNDWGVYTEAEIQERVRNAPGEVDFKPFLGKALVRASIAVEVRDGETRTRIPDDRSPWVRLGTRTEDRDAPSGLYVFTNLDARSYACMAGADGYQSDEKDVSVAVGEAATVAFLLAKTNGEGEGEGEPPGGCTGGTMEGAAPPPNTGGTVLVFALVALALARLRMTSSPASAAAHSAKGDARTWAARR